jgi:tetratricopeptide (TPR) repeat protein
MRWSPEMILAGANHISEQVAAARAWLDENDRKDPRTARELIDLLLPKAQAAGDASGSAWLLFRSSWLSINADEFEEGARIAESARSIFENLGDRVGMARCLNALGVAYVGLGVYDLALDCYRESISEATEAGRLDLMAAPSWNTAECLCLLEEPREALLIIEQCRRDYPIASFNIASGHIQTGSIYRSLGQFEEAERELLEGIRTAGDARHDALEARQVLADVYLDSGRLDEAESTTNSGLEECESAGERMYGTRFRLTRARLAMTRNRHAEAIADIEISIASAKELGARKIEADGERALYQAWQACGGSQKALAAFMRHTALKDAMKSEQTSRRILGLHDDRARREARHFETLYNQISAISEIGQRITANLNLEEILENLHATINSLMDAPTLLIALVNEVERTLDYRLVMVRGERQASFRCAADEETMGWWCVRHRRDILIGNFEAEYRQYISARNEILATGRTEQSMVFVPLMIGEKVVGMMSVQSHLPNAYDKRKVESIRAIGAYVAIAIENARLFRQVVDSEKSLRHEHNALLMAQAELKQLHGFIPICAACKKIRGDEGSWHQLESYIRDHSEAEFTHGICPDCRERLYGDLPANRM